MIISIMLLLVLQFFWLRSSYQNEREQLRKETTALFKSTLFTIQDSLIQQRIKFIPDSTGPGKEKIERVEYWRRTERDSTFHLNLQNQEARVQLYIGGDAPPDSLQRLIRPLTERMLSGQRNFVIRLEGDTLNMDSIYSSFQAVLYANNIDLPFTIYKLKRGEELSQGDSIISDPVRFPPFERYSVIYASPAPFLLKKIGPQALFSVFLTLITTSAFFMMYRSLRSQQRLMQIKNDFISNVSHELKTPVATVSVAIEALKSFQAINNPTKTAEYLDIAQNELRRLTLMTDKILKTAVFENQEILFQKEKVNLTAIIENVLTSLKLVIEKQGAAVNFNTDSEPLYVLGDPAHLTNMIYNLIDNALKYSPSESSVTISLTKKEDEIEFVVQDNGIGISSEHHKKIFERFFRVSSGDVHNTKGYGLGLSYVANVIEKHGGRIKLDSALNRGSQFFIYLPLTHGQD